MNPRGGLSSLAAMKRGLSSPVSTLRTTAPLSSSR
jgi:hypothetical protein